jgi:hypothetical protein
LVTADRNLADVILWSGDVKVTTSNVIIRDQVLGNAGTRTYPISEIMSAAMQTEPGDVTGARCTMLGGVFLILLAMPCMLSSPAGLIIFVLGIVAVVVGYRRRGPIHALRIRTKCLAGQSAIFSSRSEGQVQEIVDAINVAIGAVHNPTTESATVPKFASTDRQVATTSDAGQRVKSRRQ